MTLNKVCFRISLWFLYIAWFCFIFNRIDNSTDCTNRPIDFHETYTIWETLPSIHWGMDLPHKTAYKTYYTTVKFNIPFNNIFFYMLDKITAQHLMANTVQCRYKGDRWWYIYIGSYKIIITYHTTKNSWK